MMRPHNLAVLCVTLLGACSTQSDPDPDSTGVDGSVITDTQSDADPSDGSARRDAGDGETDALPPLPQPLATPWVAVRDGRLVDEWGRELLLRGINARVEGLFDVTFDDGRIPLQPIPDFNATDAAEAVAMGFNFLRLPINWSGIEPVEGEFDEAYVERIQQVVDLATDAGLYVLIDFHQDAYSKEIGEDGAPLWAIEPPPAELLQGPLTDLAQRRLSAQVQAAFSSFFQNEAALQERFLPALELIVTRFASDGGVIGIEVMNEPVANDDDALYAFYELAVTRMRTVDTRHTVWLEPDTIRNFTLASRLRAEPFPDDNVVYCPHMYPNLGGIVRDTPEQWVNQLNATYDALVEEASSWGNAAVVVGEWGIDPRAPQAAAYMDAIDRLSDARVIGHAFWLWKERSQGSWGLYEFDEGAESWSPRTAAVEAFTRNAALAVPGRITLHSSNREDGAMRVEFVSDGTEVGAPLLYLLAGHWEIAIDGQTLLSTPASAGSGRVEIPWRPESGAHVMVVRSGGR